MLKLRLTALMMLAVALFFSCAVNPVTGKKEFMLMSVSEEKALGAAYDPEVISQFGLYEDEKLQQFITLHGEQMGRISHRPELDYQFRILDSPVVNAFAVPGGYVYFTRGIMAHFNNEAEFAGVLGHEIGHVAARHSAKQYSNSVLAQLGFVLGMVLSEEFRNYSDLAMTGLNLLFLSYSRKHESQSDKLGVEYATKIGYDAHQMANFFKTIERLQQRSGGGIPTILSTHPDPGDRFNRVHQLATKAQQGLDPSSLKVNRNEYLRLIDGIVYGEDPRQGYVDGSVFYHPTLHFQFPVPASWQVQNFASQVQILPSDGKAAMVLTLAQEKTLAEAARAAIAKDSLRVISQRNTRIDGNDAIEITADLSAEVRLLMTLIHYGDHIYKFAGLASTPAFNTYKPFFEKSFNGFKALTDPARIDVQPERIRIVSASADGTLEQALRQHGMPAERIEELSILNGMQPGDRVQRGMLIKIIGK